MTPQEWPGVGQRALRQLRIIAQTLVGPPVHATPPSAHRRSALICLIGLPLVLLTLLFADDRVLARVGTLPPIVERAGYIGSQFGSVEAFCWSLGALLILLAVLWLFSQSPMLQERIANLFARVGFLFVAICLSLLVTSLLKIIIGRVRPYAPGTTGAFDFVPIIAGKIHSGGMPSGHATVVAAAAIAVGALWPNARPFIWAYAAMVLISRVLVRDHYPSDVLLGAIVGIVIASLTTHYFANRDIAVTRDARGRLIPNPYR